MDNQLTEHGQGHAGHGGAGHGTAAAGPPPSGLITDPVCGMTVDPATSRHRFDHGGTTYHFCSAGCRAKFAAAPDSYLQPEPAAAAPAKPSAIYTCPLHPQVRQVGPGACPICGMALEPVEVSAEAQPNHELADMSRWFWVGLVLTLPVFILEMGSHVPGLGLHALVPPKVSTWVQFALATPVVLWAGWPFLQRGWASVRSGHLNMFTLIALGTGAAYLYSLAATFAPGAVPGGVPHDGWHGARVLRSGGCHHGPGPARPGAGAARPRPDRRRHTGVAEPRAQDRPPPARRRRGRGGAARRGPGRRPAARAAGRRRAQWTA